MSHIVEIETQVRDPAAVHAACQRLKLAIPSYQTVQLFSDRETGLTVQLPGWTYPVVCNTASGQLKFDNFEGRWGDQRELDRFLQAYAIEKARIEAQKRPLGHRAATCRRFGQTHDPSRRRCRMTKIIEVVIHPDGTTNAETQGFSGAGCREATKFLEQALGRRASEKLTAEFYSHAAQNQNVRQ